MATGKLKVLISLVDKASSPLKKFGGVLSSIGKIAAGNLLAGFGRDAARALGSAATSALKTGVDFQHAMAQVNASLDVSAGQLKTLELKFRELGESTIFTASEVAAAGEVFAKAGLEPIKIYNILADTLNLAAAGQLTIARSADIVTSVMNQFKLSVEDLPSIVDLLAKTAQSAKVDVENLGKGFGFAGQTAAQLGFSVTETAAAFAMLAEQGVPQERLGRVTRAAMLEIVKGVDEFGNAVQGLGVDLKFAEDGTIGFVDMLTQLENAGVTGQDAIFKLSNVAGGAVAAWVDNVEAIRTLVIELEDRLGFALDVTNKRTESLSGDVVELGSALKGMAIVLQKNVDPMMRAAVQSLTALVRETTAGTSDFGALRTASLSLALVLIEIADTFIVVSAALFQFGQNMVGALVQMSFFSSGIRQTINAMKGFFGFLKETGEEVLKENEVIARLRATLAALRETIIALQGAKPITPEDLDAGEQAIENAEGLIITVTAQQEQFVRAHSAMQAFLEGGVRGLNELLSVMAERFGQAEARVEGLGKIIQRNVRGVAVGAAFALGDALIDAATGANRSFSDFFKQLLIDLAKAILQALILKAILSAGGGGAGAGLTPVGGGGIIGAQGGFLPSGARSSNRTRDSVPALLTPGEAVLPVELTDFLLEAAAGVGARGQDIAVTIESDIPALVTKVNRRVRNRSVSLEASKLITSRGSV